MTLSEELVRIRGESKQEFDKIHRSIKSMRASFNKRVKPLEAYVANQTVLKEAKAEGTISISREVFNIIKWLVLIIAAIVGASQL